MALYTEDSGLLFEVLDVLAATTVVGGGWERAIQYRLRLVPMDQDAPVAPEEAPVVEAILRFEHRERVEPNPDWGRIVVEDAEDGDGARLMFAMGATLAAVEAQIRDAQHALPLGVLIFRSPGDPSRRHLSLWRESAKGELGSFSSVVISTSLAEARSALVLSRSGFRGRRLSPRATRPPP